MPGLHSLLSPSGAERWLTCTPSARLEETFPETQSAFADEGTLAHQLAELLLRQKLGKIKKIQFRKEVAAIQANDLYNDAMWDYIQDYTTFVLEEYAEAQAHTKDALIFLEQKLNLSEFIEEGYGTGDVVIIANHALTIIDLKYGKGVPVSAVENKQMMLYALGALREFDFIYDVHQLKMIISQPRLSSLTSYEIGATDLKQWGYAEVMPKAAAAFSGEGEYIAGVHCRFCRAKALCKTNAAFNLEMAKHDFRDPNLLGAQDISDILNRAKLFTNWLSAVENYALAEAVNNGKEWPGYKVVEGRSSRKIVDEEKAIERLEKLAVPQDLYLKIKLEGITALEKNLGKEKLNDYLGTYILKPPGKPTLTTLDDKRPAYNSNEAAKLDFAIED